MKLHQETHYISSHISMHKHTRTRSACALHSKITTQHKCHTEMLPDLCIPGGQGPAGNKYTFSQICLYMQGTPVKIHTLTHWNLTGHNTTTPLFALSPMCSLSLSLSLLSPTSQCAFLPSRKSSVQHISIMSLLLVFHFFESLKMSNLKMCQ